MTLPLVSVVIPAYNSVSYIGGAIQSVLDQSYSNIEILVIDDGSIDNTRDVVAPFGERVRYMHQENRGASAARNRGIREARGSYVAFLDADDLWHPAKLSRQVDVLEQHPDFGAVHCGTSRMDETGGPLPDGSSRRKQRVNGNVFMEFFEANLSVILTSTVLVRRSCFDSIGMFDGSGEVVDDHDFFLRLVARYSVWYIEEALVRYRVILGSLSRVRAVQRLEQHRRTIERAITSHPAYFANKPPRYLKQRWRSFYRWGGLMLYYRREYRAARRYLQKAFLLSPRILPRYLITFLRRTPTEDASRKQGNQEGRM